MFKNINIAVLFKKAFEKVSPRVKEALKKEEESTPEHLKNLREKYEDLLANKDIQEVIDHFY